LRGIVAARPEREAKRGGLPAVRKYRKSANEDPMRVLARSTAKSIRPAGIPPAGLYFDATDSAPTARVHGRAFGQAKSANSRFWPVPVLGELVGTRTQMLARFGLMDGPGLIVERDQTRRHFWCFAVYAPGNPVACVSPTAATQCHAETQQQVMWGFSSSWRWPHHCD
jgi:hypothetical protein